MSFPPTRPAKPPRVWDDPRIVMPDATAWERMTPAERDATEERILGALDEYREDIYDDALQARAQVTYCGRFTTEELAEHLQAIVDRFQATARTEAEAAAESQQAAAAATDRAARLTVNLATSILRVCERRGLSLDDRQRARVIAEDDGDRLASWLDRALVAEASDDVFADA